MRFDAPTFARAWLSVAQASSSDKDLATLDRTVALEEFPAGALRVSFPADVPEMRACSAALTGIATPREL